MAAATKDALVISSHVVSGAVGNRAMVFALERLGHAAWAVPTVVLPHHPGRGPVTPVVPIDGDFASLGGALARLPGIERIGGIITGYFASVGQVRTAAALIDAVKAANPAALYLCDPVLGDAADTGGGRLYVGEEIAAAIRDTLLPRADIATPNRFECAWLAGRPGDLSAPATEVAQALAPDTVVVTSHPALIAGRIGNLMVRPTETLLAEHRRVATAVKGSGDLFAALLLARLMEGHGPAQALEIASNSVFAILAAAARLKTDEMPLAAAQEALVRPASHVGLRRLGSVARPAGARA